jgi:hypothetical protein
MRGCARGLITCVPMLGYIACQSEVTIHLLDGYDASTQEAEADTNGPAEAGFAEDAEASDDTVPEAASPIPCEVPASCEAGDEDCAGSLDVVDGGCGYGVLWMPQPDGSFLGHDAGGVMFFETCPTGAVLVGMTVGLGHWLNQVSAICRPVVLEPDPTLGPLPFAVTLGARINTPYAPASSTDPTNEVQDLLCPDGLTLTGVDGTTTTDTPRYILGIALLCAPPILAATTNGVVLDTDRSQAQTVGPLVCTSTCSTSQAYNYSATVPTGQVATSLFGNDGLWVDRVGFGTSIGQIARDEE